MSKMRAFRVWSRSTHEHVDTVFYEEQFSESEVRRSLINHDGYDTDILVIKERKDGTFRNYTIRD